MVIFGRTLHRIKAIISFGSVSAGDIGGWIEKEENLTQYGDAWVSGNANVYGNARVSGDAMVSGNANVSGDAWVSGNANVYGNARVSGDAMVSGNANVSGDAMVSGNAWVSGDAHIMWISKIGRRNDTVTFMRSKELKIIVSVGCFKGTIDEFEEKVKQTHGENEHAQAYFLAIQLAKLRIDLEE